MAGMVLHCAARLGLLSHIYENRDRIALLLGVITEIPIATCSGEYDFSTTFAFQLDDRDNIPISIVHPEEINLFFQSPRTIEVPFRFSVKISNNVYGFDKVLNSFVGSIFHPPSQS